MLDEIDSDYVANWFRNEVFSIMPKYNGNLYHYTDCEGMMGIVNSKELWLTHRAFMNDINEPTHPRKFLKEFPYKLSYGSYSFFILSLSTEEDLNNQWFNYGKRGSYCIVFDSEKLSEYFTQHSLFYQFNSGLVIYNDEVKLEIANKVNNFNLRKLDNDAVYTFGIYYNIVNLLFKEKQSMSEYEYRYFIGSSDFDFRNRGGIVTPFYRLSGMVKKNRLPIKGIIIGPDIHDSMAEVGLRYFLDSNGFYEGNCFIKKSMSNMRRID